MVTIRKIKSDEYREAGNLIKTTIMISFKQLYPEILIQEFCKKYNYDNFKIKAKKYRNVYCDSK